MVASLASLLHSRMCISVSVWHSLTGTAHGTLRNRILAFGLNAIVAQVYKAPSWFDGRYEAARQKVTGGGKDFM